MNKGYSGVFDLIELLKTGLYHALFIWEVQLLVHPMFSLYPHIFSSFLLS